MEIERYYDEDVNIAAITTNTYASSVEFVEMLTEKILLDFADDVIKKNDLQIVIYGKPRKEGQLGIHFYPPSTPPKEYKRFPLYVLCDNYIF